MLKSWFSFWTMKALPPGIQPNGNPAIAPGYCCGRVGAELHVAVQDLQAPQDLGLLEAAHPGRIGEHRRGILCTGGIACRSEPHVGRTELVEHDPTGPGRPPARIVARARQHSILVHPDRLIRNPRFMSSGSQYIPSWRDGAEDDVHFIDSSVLPV